VETGLPTREKLVELDLIDAQGTVKEGIEDRRDAAEGSGGAICTP
jgi:hypothetical protein